MVALSPGPICSRKREWSEPPLDRVGQDSREPRTSGGRPRPYKAYPFNLRFLPLPLVPAKDYLTAQAASLADSLGRAPLVYGAWNQFRCAAAAQAFRRAGVVFIHIPKTCGTSISQVLYGRNLPHFSAWFYAENAPRWLRELPSFAVIREPIERTVSAWRFARGRGSEQMAYNHHERSRLRGLGCLDDFVAFLADSELSTLPSTFWRQSDFVSGADGVIMVDRLFAFRTQDGLPSTLTDFLGAPVPHLNTSRAFDARLSSRSLDTLRRLYALDITIYERLVAAGGTAGLRHSPTL